MIIRLPEFKTFILKLNVLIILFLLPVFGKTAWGQTSGDYRSLTSGNWATISTWQSYNGSAWVAATSAPTSASGVITILNGHIVSVSANVQVDQVIIDAGGQVTVNATRTLTIANGTGTDMTVNGTLVNSGTITTTGTLVFNSGSTYQHAMNAGTIPTATWNAASTCLITGVTSATALGGFSQNFGNLTWNCTGQAGVNSLPNSNYTIAGTLTITSTGSSSVQIVRGSYTGNMANYVQTGGTVIILSSGTSLGTVNISGSFSLNGGTFNMDSGTGTNASVLNIGGNFTMSAGTFTRTSTASAISRVNFSGTAFQIFSRSAGTISGAINFAINSGSTVNFGTSVLNGSTGTFILNSGGNIITAHTQGLSTTVGTGSIQVTGTKTYSTGASYTYNGTSAQVTGNGLPSTVSNLTFSNAAGVSINAAKTISNNFSITAGSFANLLTFTHSAGTLTIGGSGTASGSWGSTGSGATHKNDTYFAVTTGIINVSSTTCSVPSSPSVTGTFICIGTTAVLSASGATTGGKYKWYDAATGGTLLKTSTNDADNTFTTPVLAVTTNYWVSIMIAGECESSRIQVTATYPSASSDSQTAAGTDSWIGHVYDGINFATYFGHFTETETFDQNFGGDLNCFNVISNSVVRSIYTETFSVRYRMNSSRKGLYIADMGSEDGTRLTVDGALIFNNWTDQSYSSIPRVLMNLNGASSLIYEYYENVGGNRVTFQTLTQVLANNLTTNISQSICLGNTGVGIGGDIYGTLPSGITLSGTGYQWSYSTTPGGIRTNISGATGPTYAPNTSVAPFNGTGTYYIFRNAVLSSTNNVLPNPYVATNESNAATLTVNPNLPASVNIVAGPAGAICAGTSVTFTASPTNGGTTPVYQWKVNGTVSGTNSPVYSYVPVNNDAVTCVLTSNASPCSTGSPATSNTIILTVYPVIGNNAADNSNGVHGVLCATAAENASVVLTAPAGTVFINVGFASYGNPGGTCPAFTPGACNSLNSQSVAEGYLLGNNTASIPATNTVFGDPCVGTVKSLYVTATYTEPVCAGNTPGTITGTLPAGGNGSFTYLWESSTTGSSSGFAAASGTNNLQNYTPGALSQSTWYRRIVTSGSCSDISKVVMIFVNPVITGNTISPVQTICAGSVPASLTGSSPAGGNGGFIYIWESSTASGSSGFSSASGTSNGQNYSPVSLAQTTWFRRTAISGGCTNVSTPIQISVTPMPVAAFSYTETPYCSNAADPSPTFSGGGVPGTFSSTTGLVFISTATGQINLAASTAGSYIVTNTIAASGGCGIIAATSPVSYISTLIWTGSVSTDWNIPGNWSCGFIPAISTLVQIPDVANKPVLGPGAAGTVKNIIIDNGSSLTVVGNTIQISGTISNSGTFTSASGTVEMKGSSAQLIGANVFAGNTIQDLIISNPAGVTLQGPLNITGIVTALNGNLYSAGNVTLVSIADQTALINGSGTGNITGNVTMQLYLSHGYGYKYFSSPFQAATVNEFGDDMNLLASFPSFYRYDESQTATGWVSYVDPSGILNPLQGYAVNFGSVNVPNTVDITGVVTNGALSVTLYNNNNSYTRGFNLVGNPYPSPIDWDAMTGWTKTNIDAAIYYFRSSTTDQYGGMYGSYVNGISSDDAATNIIPSMQGFFVHVTDGSFPVTGTLALNNNVRVNNLSHRFIKSANISSGSSKSYNGLNSSVPYLRLFARFGDTPDSADPLVIYFDENAKEGFDSGMDALKLMNTDVNVPNLYAVASDGSNLSINALPESDDSLMIIPLGLNTGINGSITFYIRDTGNLPTGNTIYLHDIMTDTYQKLNNSGEYKIYLNAGKYNDRFSLRFVKGTVVTPETKPSTDLFSIYYSNGTLKSDIYYISEDKGELFISNFSGQILFRQEINTGGYQEFSPMLKDGFYLVSYTTGKSIGTKKIVIINR